MKYSKATNYALHTMLFLAKATPNKLVSVHQLAEMQNVSPTYLSKILTKLTKEGMIHSSSGPKGGYSLSKNWEDISFLDIIHAIEGKTSLFDCCLHDKPGCLINEAMLAAEEKMEEELRNQKIVDLAKKIKVDF
ncbi:MULTISPECIES: Rrf2 family transcriptional regulator [Bacillus]|jgi:Rrf2 family protein|uniref:Rrf2 family transcriptional regulator n=6 Tax=Bacillus cereus group TaxID=86661 RepID=A0A9W7V239_BACCE|nr:MULTISPECIES: Rrf2 family transcriptional regulator [Bacillus]PAW41117.1 Rrf2 family transcriptional regulator [Bacillus toyonensis]AEA16434.1 RRF2 family protein [Bacillus thuringiensis serovar chinensis CT-43]AFV18571.1 RRF2 family protein [Bacillus thuringiensis Bt407]AGG01524.1 Rrf2 family transcriptional regulator [Bacillus thuringiensis serovar thuringiensis str. IS5056]AKR09767.1 Rrf2 family transcriptional regulator [Bacillus thuringiensis]